MYDNLIHFIKIVEKGSITGAAEDMHISQPALTMSVKKLEKQFKAQLLIRSKNGIKPTKAGDIVFKHAKKVRNEIKNLNKQIADFKNRKINNIHIGMIDNFTLTFINKGLDKFLKNNPEINFHFEINNSTILLEKLEQGTISFAVITASNRKLPKKFKSENIYSEDMSLIATPDIVEEINNIKDLTKYNYIAYNKNSTTNEFICKIFKKNNINPKTVAYSSSPLAIMQMTKNKLGFSILPSDFISDAINQKTLKKLDFKQIDIKRKLSLVYLKGNYLSKTDKELIDILKSFK